MSRNLDSFGQFLNDAGRISLLTAQEEIFLGKRVQDMMVLQAENPYGPYEKLQAAILRRGQRAKDRMVKANLRLVVTIARKYAHRNAHNGITIDDLVQEGSIGLMRAVEKFDPARGYKFSTYAYWWIKQSITRYLCQRSRTIRLPQYVAEKLFQVSRVTHYLYNTLGRLPTKDELAKELGMARSEFDLMIDRAAGLKSLDEMVCDEGSTLIDVVGGDESSDEHLNALDERMHLESLQHALNRLESKERDMIIMRYGLGGTHVHTYQEMATQYQLSRERVRQIVERGLRKLQLYLTTYKALLEPVPQPLYKASTLAAA